MTNIIRLYINCNYIYYFTLSIEFIISNSDTLISAKYSINVSEKTTI
jgi:hypothetical protein